MKGKKAVDALLLLTFAAIAVLSYFYLEGWVRWGMALGGGFLAVLFLVLLCRTESEKQTRWQGPFLGAVGPPAKVSELVLLNEEGKGLAVWPLYGKVSMVIGRDVGENNVDVNLSSATYASMVEVEHAVLNYSGGEWYIEDLASKNGVSVQKKEDGKKYKLAPDKPCRVESGDVILIAMTRLLLR